VEYWDYFFAKWFCSLGDVLVPTGQLYLINVWANTTSDPNLPLPKGAENLSKDCLYLKIGMGNTPLKKLPWIGVTNIEIVENSINTYLSSDAGIDQIESITEGYLNSDAGINEINVITENYLDSEAGIGQVEGITEGYLNSTAGAGQVKGITEGYLDSTAGAGQINKISLKFLDTEDAKKKLDIQTNQYIRSSKGTSQINGIISNYLTNGGYDDEDIGDGLIINCN
jgi:hypothetical protein